MDFIFWRTIDIIFRYTIHLCCWVGDADTGLEYFMVSSRIRSCTTTPYLISTGYSSNVAGRQVCAVSSGKTTIIADLLLTIPGPMKADGSFPSSLSLFERPF